MKNTLIGFTVFTLTAFTTSSQIVLNEVASTNVELIADLDGDFPDWIEDNGMGIKLAPDTLTSSIMKKVLNELESNKKMFSRE